MNWNITNKTLSVRFERKKEKYCLRTRRRIIEIDRIEIFKKDLYVFLYSFIEYYNKNNKLVKVEPQETFYLDREDLTMVQEMVQEMEGENK